MAATSMSGAEAAALAITAYMAIVGGNGLAYVVLFGLLGRKWPLLALWQWPDATGGLEHLLHTGPALSCSLSLSLSPSQSSHPLNLTLIVLPLPLEGKTKGLGEVTGIAREREGKSEKGKRGGREGKGDGKGGKMNR
jgi:hypothetical protein